MTRFLLILHAVLAMHRWQDRNEPNWDERADTIAQVVDAQTDEGAGVLKAIMEPESGTGLAAHEGRTYYRGLWQLDPKIAADAGELLMFAGTDLESTQYSAETALRVYHRALTGCRGNAACAMSRYAGTRKTTKQAKRRAFEAKAFERLLSGCCND